MTYIKDYKKVAIKDNGREVTYRELLEMAKSYSDVLGVEKGDRVVLFAEKSPEVIFSIFAIWDKKACCVSLDDTFSATTLEYYINDSDPKVIITSEKNYKKVEEVLEKLAKEDIKIFKVEELKNTHQGTGEIELNHPGEDEIAFILYTSGTTGDPKGVMLSYGNIQANLNGLNGHDIFRESDVVLAMLPLYHVLPLVGSIIIPMLIGAQTVLLSDLSAKALKACLNENGVTIVIGVPRVYELLHRGIMDKIKSSKIKTKIFNIAKKIKSLKIRKAIFKEVHKGLGGKLRFFISGGSKLDIEVAGDILTLGIELLEGYGMTETAPMMAFTPRGESEPGCVGRILPGTEMKINDDGEILTKGPHVMLGYFKKPEATAETIIDGWLHTGDLGELKDGNRLYITGRKKEMIVLSNGKNINPVEIEGALQRSSGLIKEAAVTEHEGLLTAIIFPDFQKIKEENITNIKETIKWHAVDKYNAEVPSYRKIHSIEIVPKELPKTKIGKIRRFLLEDFLNDLDKEDVVFEEPKFEEYQILATYLKKVSPRAIAPNAHIELDLGLDSLELIELQSFTEDTFGIQLSEGILSEHSTVEELARYFEENKGKIELNQDVNWHNILNKKTMDALPKTPFSATMMKVFASPITALYVDKKVEGEENILEGPCIYALNHQSFLDGFIINETLPKKIRNKTFYLAINTHFRGWLRGQVAKNGNIILVDLNKGLKGTLTQSSQILLNGGNIGIFPEGARSRDGKMIEFKKTFAILAKELNVPIVPVGLCGAYDIMPYGAKKPKRGQVTIKFFEGIKPDDLDPEELSQKTHDIIEDWLKSKK